MTVTENDVDYVSAPSNYADLFTIYYSYVINLCGQFGIDDNNKEDAASEILTRFMERRSLEKFDPHLEFEYRGEARPARFKSYLSRAVDMYSRGIRDKQHKLARREYQINDVVPVPGQHQSEWILGSANARWVEVFGEATPDPADGVHDMFDEEVEANTVRALLAQVPLRSTQDRCDLVALYDAVRIQILTYGEYDISVLKDRFQVSTTAMHSWMWWLKTNLATIYGRPVPAKRARRLRAKDDL